MYYLSYFLLSLLSILAPVHRILIFTLSLIILLCTLTDVEEHYNGALISFLLSLFVLAKVARAHTKQAQTKKEENSQSNEVRLGVFYFLCIRFLSMSSPLRSLMHYISFTLTQFILPFRAPVHRL